MFRRIARLALAAAVVAALAASTRGALAAPGQSLKDPKVAAEVPSTIRAKGTLIVAADATYAPNEFVACERPDRRRHGCRPRPGTRQACSD